MTNKFDIIFDHTPAFTGVLQVLTQFRGYLSNGTTYLTLLRPGNVLFTSILTFIGAFVAGGSLGDLTAVAAAVFATITTVGAGNTINDYFDRHIDAINRPDRPIPSGAVEPFSAVILSLGLFGFAVLSTLFLPLVATAIVLLNTVGLAIYTPVFKPLPGVGNVAVAYLAPSYLLLGAAAVGNLSGALILFVLAALATLAREILKDIEDLAGDRENGLRTLPIVIGKTLSHGIGLAVIITAVCLSVLPYADGTFGVSYLAFVVPANGVMLASTTYSVRNPGMGQRWLKAGMVLAAVAFIMGRTAFL